MFANNKEFINPEDYLKFIKNELLEMKDLVTKLSLALILRPKGEEGELTKIYKFYFKLILLYSSISLFNLMIMV